MLLLLVLTVMTLCTVQVPGPQDPAGGQRLHAQNKGTGEPSKIVPVLRIRILDPVPFLPLDPG